MNEEELERTNMMKTMIIESSDYEEDDSIIEHIEEFEEKIDYLEIKEEENEKTREYLFKLLQKEID